MSAMDARNPRSKARLAFTIRKAGRSDILEMRAMQERSMLILGRQHYSRGELESFIGLVGTMDDAVVDEGHCFVAVDPFERVIGTGAWSRLLPSFASARQDAGTATVRSVFVAPECARRGIAQSIMQKIEADAAASGIVRLELSAALSGEAFYRALGYAAASRDHVELPDGSRVSCMRMSKSIAAGGFTAA